MNTYLRRHWLVRGLFLSVIGPVLGTMTIIIPVPLLAFGFILGRRMWEFIYLIGLVPSVITSSLVIAMEIRGASRLNTLRASFPVSSISTFAWLSYLFWQGGYTVAHFVIPLVAAVCGMYLTFINYKLMENG